MLFPRLRIPFFFALLFFAGSLPAWAFDLTLFHTNDLHAAYGGITRNGSPCYDAICEGGAGGAVRIRQQVQSFLKDFTQKNGEDRILFLDAGDQFQGTLFYKVHKSRIVADIVNALNYTAIVPGNHEFDDGCPEFFSYLERLQVPVVAANLELPANAPRIRPWVVVERAGRKIGIIGLVSEKTPQSSSPCMETRFSSAKDALKKSVKELQAQGVDILIALTHIGLDKDIQLATEVDGVDVIVGGHTHSLLSNEDKKAVGPYPVVAHSPSGQPVLIVTAKSSGTLLGFLRVVFDDAGIPTSWTGEPLLLKDAPDPAHETLLPFDPPLMQTLASSAESIQALLRQSVGSVVGTEPLDADNGRICWVRECRTGNVIADSMLAATAAEKTSVALTNGGIVRASLRGGDVSRADVMSIIPFENRLFVGTLSGQKLLQVLEFGLSAYESGGGRFLQVAGVRMGINPNLPRGKRLLRADVFSTPRNVWLPIDPKAEYRIVIPDYMARGGDGFALLKAINWKDTGILQDAALADFISSHPSLSPQLENRIRIETE